MTCDYERVDIEVKQMAHCIRNAVETARQTGRGVYIVYRNNHLVSVLEMRQGDKWRALVTLDLDLFDRNDNLRKTIVLHN